LFFRDGSAGEIVHNLRMAIAVVRLGSPRGRNEGIRVGTVRRPPRGVPKARIAARDFYDVWLPELSPSPGLVAFALKARDDRAWNTFARRYRAEMKRPEPARLLDLFAALSHRTNLAVGCYCEDERRCHRSILGQLLAERGAALERSSAAQA
jgi:uncharacterized protein YeaO (DUF488 family)